MAVIALSFVVFLTGSLSDHVYHYFSAKCTPKKISLLIDSQAKENRTFPICWWMIIIEIIQFQVTSLIKYTNIILIYAKNSDWTTCTLLCA